MASAPILSPDTHASSSIPGVGCRSAAVGSGLFGISTVTEDETAKAVLLKLYGMGEAMS
jgi:hypothetical protein